MVVVVGIFSALSGDMGRGAGDGSLAFFFPPPITPSRPRFLAGGSSAVVCLGFGIWSGLGCRRDGSGSFSSAASDSVSWSLAGGSAVCFGFETETGLGRGGGGSASSDSVS